MVEQFPVGVGGVLRRGLRRRAGSAQQPVEAVGGQRRVVPMPQLLLMISASVSPFSRSRNPTPCSNPSGRGAECPRSPPAAGVSGRGRNPRGRTCRAVVARRGVGFLFLPGQDRSLPQHSLPLHRRVGDSQSAGDAGVVTESAQVVGGRPVADMLRGEPTVGGDVVDVRPVRLRAGVWIVQPARMSQIRSKTRSGWRPRGMRGLKSPAITVGTSSSSPASRSSKWSR